MYMLWLFTLSQAVNQVPPLLQGKIAQHIQSVLMSETNHPVQCHLDLPVVWQSEMQ